MKVCYLHLQNYDFVHLDKKWDILKIKIVLLRLPMDQVLIKLLCSKQICIQGKFITVHVNFTIIVIDIAWQQYNCNHSN